MTNEDFQELARRLVACPHFRWRIGMLNTDGQVCVDVDPGGIEWFTVATGDAEFTAADGRFPDIRDPGTLGHVLQLVREAWGAPGASSGQTRTRDWSVGGIAAGDSDPSWFGWGRSEAEALVAALEAASPR